MTPSAPPVPADAYPFTRTGTHRRKFIVEHLPQAWESKVLEIGAFDNATFVPSEAHVRYVDWLSKEELVAAQKDNKKRRTEVAVDVDYVLGERQLTEVVDDSFDLVVANHVIEHIPDIISWMNSLAEITTAGAHLFLAIPDRRFTFDMGREVTDAVEMLRCHEEGLTRPSVFQVLRSRFYHQSVKPVDVWAGTHKASSRRIRGNLREELEFSRKLASTYCDSHCSVFTYDSFATTWQDLVDAQLVPWRIEAIQDAQKNDNEFRVLMKKIT